MVEINGKYLYIKNKKKFIKILAIAIAKKQFRTE